MKIITGATGTEHVTAADDGSLLATLFGTSQFVLPLGNQLEHEVISATKIRIKSGDLMVHGRYARIPHGTYDEVTIENGATGYNRNDLIVCRYEETDGIESMTLKVVKGTPSTGAAADPTVTTGNILNGDSVHEFPLYRVKLSGINLSSVEKLFTVWAMNETHTHTADQLPDLTASMLPTVPVSKGGTGKTTRKAGFENLSRITPPSSDTPAAWAEVGDGYCQYAVSLFDGILLNLNSGTDLHYQLIFGIFREPFIYFRRKASDGSWGSGGWQNSGSWKPAVQDNESIELTSNTSNTPEKSTYACYYDPVKKRVYFRGYVASRSSKVFESGVANVMWTVPSSYRPPTRYALAVSNGGAVMGQSYIGTDGTINLIARGGNINVGNAIYITGWWDVKVHTL